MKTLLARLLIPGCIVALCLATPSSNLFGDEDGNSPSNPGIRKVELASDGNLIGRVQTTNGQAVPASSVLVSFYQNGELKGQSEPGEGGYFQVAGMAPGVYSVVVEGPGGVTSFPLLVLPPGGGPEGTPKRLDLYIDPVVASVNQLGPEGYPGFPFGGPAPYGGGMGGGGYGGGAGIWGALLGAAGVGLGAAALADNNNGDTQIVSASAFGF